MAPGSDFFQCASNPKVPAGRDQSLFENFDGLLWAPGILIHLRQVQIELRVVVPDVDRFVAERLGVGITLLG